MALNATNIRVNWTIPQAVSSQGLSAFSIVVIPECVSGVTRGGTQVYNDNDETVTMRNFGSLGKVGVV